METFRFAFDLESVTKTTVGPTGELRWCVIDDERTLQQAWKMTWTDAKGGRMDIIEWRDIPVVKDTDGESA